MFQHTRDPDPAWQEQLNAIAQPNQRTPWLKLVWMPGEVYEPVQRWVIYEMQPNLALLGADDPEAYDRLIGEMRKPHPRENGRWLHDPDVPGGKRWHSDSLVSKMQYELFHEYNAWPTLLWVVQGPPAGHQWRLEEYEDRAWRLISGEDAEWPAPGDLQYREFSVAVVKTLAERDRLREWEQRMAGRWEERYQKHGTLHLPYASSTHQRSLADEKRKLNADVEKWLSEQLYGVQSAMTESLAARILENAPRSGSYIPEDRIEEEFLES